MYLSHQCQNISIKLLQKVNSTELGKMKGNLGAFLAKFWAAYGQICHEKSHFYPFFIITRILKDEKFSLKSAVEIHNNVVRLAKTLSALGLNMYVPFYSYNLVSMLARVAF